VKTIPDNWFDFNFNPWTKQGRTRLPTWKKPLLWNRRSEIKFNSWENIKQVYPGMTDGYLVEQGLIAPRRPRVFCGSLCDVFFDSRTVDAEWVRDLFALICDTPNLTWVLPTHGLGMASRVTDCFLDNIRRTINVALAAATEFETDPQDEKVHNMCHAWADGKPPHNLWLASRFSCQAEAVGDIATLLQNPAAKHVLLLDPMREPVRLPFDRVEEWNEKARDNITNWQASAIDWVIVSGDTSGKAVPLHPNSVRAVRDQCAEAGVPFFFSNWGDWVDEANKPAEAVEATAVWRLDSKTVVSRVGHKFSGRSLDGREHREFPK
jgi:protein gp37